MYKTVKPTTFTLPLGILQDLDFYAKDLGKKKTAIVTEALEMWMDYQDVRVAQKRLKSGEKGINADEFFKDLGV